LPEKKKKKNWKELDHIKARRAQLIPVVVFCNWIPFVPLSISRKKQANLPLESKSPHETKQREREQKNL
jgi:hypothetical protein